MVAYGVSMELVQDQLHVALHRGRTRGGKGCLWGEGVIYGVGASPMGWEPHLWQESTNYGMRASLMGWGSR